MIQEVLSASAIDFLKVLPILVVAIIASQIIKYYLPKEKIGSSFEGNEKNITKASAIGLVTPGPLLAYLPLLKTLKEKGLAVSIIVAFITSQTLIGPMRLFLEVGYFGIAFFAYRLVLAFLIAIGIATCFRFLEKYIKF